VRGKADMVHIPFGPGFIDFEEGSAPVLCSAIGELKARGSGSDIVRAAMENPIDSPRLSELAKGKRSCVIIISDHTRPVPSRDILPNMLRELREGSPDIQVTLLVATGFHRPTSTAELEAKLSHEQSEKESAQSALARLNEQLTTLKMTLEANSADKAVVDEAPSADKTVVDKVPVEAMDAAGSV